MQLTDGIFETGAYGVPSKSQDPTVLGQGGPSSTQCSNLSWACRQNHLFGTKSFILTLIFFFFAKIRLKITNIWCGVSGNLSEQE